jgi:hypothetical protein
MEDYTLPLIVVGALVVVGLGFWFMRTRTPKEQPIYHFRCPGCLRKLRYQERQVGHKGECGYCKQSITFPPLSWSLEGGRGKKKQAAEE